MKLILHAVEEAHGIVEGVYAKLSFWKMQFFGIKQGFLVHAAELLVMRFINQTVAKSIFVKVPSGFESVSCSKVEMYLFCRANKLSFIRQTLMNDVTRQTFDLLYSLMKRRNERCPDCEAWSVLYSPVFSKGTTGLSSTMGLVTL